MDGPQLDVRAGAVFLAAKYGCVDVLKFFEGGVDFGAGHNEAARLAAKHGHLDVLEFLEGKPGVDFSAVSNGPACDAAVAGHRHVLKFLEEQPRVRMGTYLRTFHYPDWRERRAREDKQDAFVTKARSGGLTMDDVDQAAQDKHIIFRELEGLPLNAEVSESVDNQIAKEYRAIRWRRGNSRQLLAHWADGRETIRLAGNPPRPRRCGSDLLFIVQRLPRHALLTLLQQTSGAK